MAICHSYFGTLTRVLPCHILCYRVTFFVAAVLGCVIQEQSRTQAAHTHHQHPAYPPKQCFQRLADTVPPTFTPPRSKCVELDTCTVFAQTIFWGSRYKLVLNLLRTIFWIFYGSRTLVALVRSLRRARSAARTAPDSKSGECLFRRVLWKTNPPFLSAPLLFIGECRPGGEQSAILQICLSV